MRCAPTEPAACSIRAVGDRSPASRRVLQRTRKASRDRHHARVGPPCASLRCERPPTPLLDQIRIACSRASRRCTHRHRPPVLGLPVSRTATPPMRAHILQVEDPARARVRPPVPDGTVDQPQQLELGLRAHARREPEKPERCLPRTTSARPPSPSALRTAGRSPQAPPPAPPPRRHPPRLRRRERSQRRVLRQRPQPNDHAHVDTPLPRGVGLRDLLRSDLQKDLPLLLRRQLRRALRLPFSIITPSWFEPQASHI